MKADGRGERIQRLFLDAARLPADDREPWLRSQCLGDDQLFDDVRSLLHYDNPAHDPLESGLAFATDLLSPLLRDKQELPTVPGYRIVREIGTGGQAIVYEAIQESTTQRVALKMLRWGQIASTHERERLRREVLILARLSHPGIVAIIDSGETDSGVFFIATQFVDGPRLDQLYDASTDERRSDEASASGKQGDVLRLFVKICAAVDAAHRAGVVHRDLKPANILIDREGDPRILDFGLAKPGLCESLDTPGGIALTRSGQFMGSLPWASPEQAEGQSVDVRSDVYSLGVILYQLVSGGRFPYDVSGSLREVITKIMHADPTPLDRLTHDTRQIRTAPSAKLVDAKLNVIVLKALAKSPDNRYQSAAELAGAINHFLSGVRGDSSELEVQPIGAQRQPRKLSRWIILGVLLAGLGTLIGFAVSGRVLSSGSRRSMDNELSKEPTPAVWRPIEVVDVDRRLFESLEEFAFPAINGETFAIRGTVRREAGKSATVTLRSTEGRKVALEIRNEGELRLFGPEVFDATANVAEDLTDFVFAVLPNRCVISVGGQWLMQLHFKTAGRWYPTIEPHRSAELQKLEYLLPAEDAFPSLPWLPDEEHGALDFLISVGGSASSVPDDGSKDCFRVEKMTALTHESTQKKDAELISRCRKVTLLRLTGLSDDAIPHLARLPMLEQLSIWNSTLSAGSIEQLNLEKLVGLDLWQTLIVNADFSPLANAERLEYLGIPRIELTDENLKQLAEIKSLKMLYVNGRFATSDGIQLLANLSHLEELEVSKARLSGQITESFSKLQQVTWLNLRDSNLRDADIEDLSQLRHLRVLDLEGSNLSQGGLQKLAELLPNCQINPTPEPKSD